MSIASALGLGGKKVRYGIVALGDISQGSLMPAVAHTGNSEITALVSSDVEKLAALGDLYNVDNRYSYDEFPALLASGQVDAIYLATPNWRHAEFAIPALEAGIHVLCEKPLEVNSDLCRAMMEAEKRGGAKLMTAYRLHFEPANLDAIRRIRAGELGDLIAFSGGMGQVLDPANHRAKHGVQGGPLFDLAPYPINAIRFLFGAEPVEVVSAVGTRHPEADLGDFDDTLAVTLRMPGNQLAQFVVSYYANRLDNFTITGTKGTIEMSPAFGLGDGLAQTRRIGDDDTHEQFPATDQFGGELRYFSDCILNDRPVEPSGEEGLVDLLVVEAIMEALRTGQPAKVEPFTRSLRIDPEGQEQRLRPVSAPKKVNASSPSRD